MTTTGNVAPVASGSLWVWLRNQSSARNEIKRHDFRSCDCYKLEFLVRPNEVFIGGYLSAP
jgi:hypothetical protein